MPVSSSFLLLLLQREPTRRFYLALWFLRNFFKIAICMCRIKDQQVLICKTYNWIQLLDFALSFFGTLVIIMSSCQLNRPFILAPFTSCQVVKVIIYFWILLNYSHWNSLQCFFCSFLPISRHIFLVENSESNGAPFRLFPNSKYLCGHKRFNNDCFNVSNQTII